MTRLFVTIMALWLAATSLAAQDNPAIAQVITDQLAAFSARDVATAWTFASPMIQGLFGDPAVFGQMVQQGYPMVWDNADVRFLELRDINGFLWQKVMIRDQMGVFHVLDYQMVEAAGGWQINGVQLLPAPDVGA